MGQIGARLTSLREQHRKLDQTIKQMELEHADDSTVRAAKIEKLHIKDEIEKLEHEDVHLR